MYSKRERERERETEGFEAYIGRRIPKSERIESGEKPISSAVQSSPIPIKGRFEER